MNEDDLIIDIWEYYKPSKLEKLSTKELLKRLKKARKKDNWDEEKEIENELADRFGFVSRHIFQDWLADFCENLAEILNEFEEKLKNHRHETSKSYSGKAEF